MRISLAAMVCAALLAACGVADWSASAVLPTGTLRIGVDASNPPFAFPAETAPGYAGFEIDLAIRLAERLAVPYAFTGLSYDGLYDALAADRVDVVLAALPIDPARTGAVRFSPPYFNAGLVLVSDGLAGMEALPGNRLSFEYGSVAHGVALEWTRRVAPFTLIPRDTPQTALEAVRSGQAEAALVDAVSARLGIAASAGWQPRSVHVTDTLLAAATRADRPQVANLVDEAIDQLLVSGEIERMIEGWFEKTNQPPAP